MIFYLKEEEITSRMYHLHKKIRFVSFSQTLPKDAS